MHELVGREREREAIAAALQSLTGCRRDRRRAGHRQVAPARVPRGVRGGGPLHRARREGLGVRASTSRTRSGARRSTSEVGASGDRHRTHRALRARLEGLRRAPAVLWMDDVQWADPRIDRRTGGAGAPAARGAGAVRAGRTRRADAGRRGRGARRRRRRHRAEPGAADRGGGGRTGRAASRRAVPAHGRQSVLSRAARAVPAVRRRWSPRRTTGKCRRPSPPRWPPSWPRWRLSRAGCSTPPPWPAIPSSRAWRPRSPNSRNRRRCRRSTSCCSGRWCGPAGAPRRFAFRHPVVRHAVYVAAGGGWRLGAHARAAVELERRGAGPVALAHHVEHAAGPGDEDAIALLEHRRDRAPGVGARDRRSLLRRRAAAAARHPTRATHRDAAAPGRCPGGRGRPLRGPATLHGALAGAGPADRLVLTIALANWSGGSAVTKTRAAACTWCSASSRPSHPRIASGCDSRSA